MEQTCLLEKEEGNMLGVCVLLSPPFISSLDCGREKERCSDGGGGAGPYQKSRERRGGAGQGGAGVLAAPRAELLNPGHKLFSWLI